MIFILFSALDLCMISIEIIFPYTLRLLSLLPRIHLLLGFLLSPLNLKHINRQSILNIVESGRQL